MNWSTPTASKTTATPMNAPAMIQTGAELAAEDGASIGKLVDVGRVRIKLFAFSWPAPQDERRRSVPAIA